MKKALLTLAAILMAVQSAMAQNADSSAMSAQYQQMILVKNYDGALALLEDFNEQYPEDLKNGLGFFAGDDPTPAKLRLVLLVIEKSAFEKQMNNLMTK